MSNVTNETPAADAPRETEIKPKKPAKGTKRTKSAKRAESSLSYK